MKYLKTLYVRIYEHDVFGLAAQLAYFLLLSLFPLLITLFSVLPFLPITDDVIISFIDDFAPEGITDLIHQNLEEIMQYHNEGLLSFGIVLTLFSASNGINAVIKAVNRAYEVKEDRSYFIVRGLAILLTVVMIFVFVLALLLPVFGRHIGIFLFSKFGLTEEFLQVWNFLRWVGSFLILFIIFAAIYVFTPNKKMKCLVVLPGALFSSLGWMLASFGFSFYVNKFSNYTVTYGSLGVIIVLMLWLYLSGVILLFGGEINAIREFNKEQDCN